MFSPISTELRTGALRTVVCPKLHLITSGDKTSRRISLPIVLCIVSLAAPRLQLLLEFYEAPTLTPLCASLDQLFNVPDSRGVTFLGDLQHGWEQRTHDNRASLEP